MFSSLRVKLSVAFALVIFISLLLTGSAFALLIRGYSSRLAQERLADLVVPVTTQVSILERAGAPSSTISAFLKEQGDEMGVRVLLLDRNGLVVEDTQGALKGQQVNLERTSTVLSPWNRVAYAGVLRAPDHTDLYCVAGSPPPARATSEPYFSRAPLYGVVLAIPQQSIGEAWLAMAPGLSIAAVLSLIVSVGLAVFLARSIAQPVVEITQASEQVAKGHYEHTVAVKGRDEVARLATAFNDMARQIGRTNRTLRDFLANASHELKTPLTSIQGFSQAMVDGAIDEPGDYARAASIINLEAERMRTLVDDLLLLSRMESGDVALDREPVDVADLLTTCVERFRWRAEQQETELALDLTPNLGEVSGDSRRLEQLVGNLLDNALRHTPKGGSVTVKAAPVSSIDVPRDFGQRDGVGASGAGRKWVRIVVHNTGSWIPAEDLSRIFERFYRGRWSADRGGDGSGLGLAIVREIVQVHGGWVLARSDPAMGTEFEVNLPGGLPVSGQSDNRAGGRPLGNLSGAHRSPDSNGESQPGSTVKCPDGGRVL